MQLAIQSTRHSNTHVHTSFPIIYYNLNPIAMHTYISNRSHSHRMVQLLQNLPPQQISFDPHSASCTKCAAHLTPNLTGDTQCITAIVPDDHGLHSLPVLELHQQFDRAIPALMLLHHLGRGHGKLLRKRRNHAHGQLPAHFFHAQRIDIFQPLGAVLANQFPHLPGMQVLDAALHHKGPHGGLIQNGQG